LQRTCEIWAFAFSFAWRYFLLNQKWTYPKKQGGMTPAAVSARKSELAGAAAALFRLDTVMLSLLHVLRVVCTLLMGLYSGRQYQQQQQQQHARASRQLGQRHHVLYLVMCHMS
jgi:hypothetical protein